MEEIGGRVIEPNPLSPDPVEAQLLPHRVPVWAVIAQLKLDYWNTDLVAMEFELPAQTIQEAVWYYQGYRDEIDSRIAENRSFFRV